MQFGTLVHDALETWGRAERSASTPTLKSSVIENDLHAALDRFVHDRFGSRPLPVVRLQAEMVRQRLSVFARKQAERAAAGWRVHSVELYFNKHRKADHPPPRFPNADGLLLTGKIDRVDVHDTYGYQALDYKSGQKADGAKKSHWSPKRGWFNLQLPLYRVLLGSIGLGVPASGLGYVLIPPTEADCRFDIVKWTDADMDAAEATAAEVIETITSGRLLRVAEESIT
jgi:RecB family exonuclease